MARSVLIEQLSRADATEREAFMEYVEAVGARAGHTATAAQARAACPSEFAAWREAFRREYGFDPITEQAA